MTEGGHPTSKLLCSSFSLPLYIKPPALARFAFHIHYMAMTSHEQDDPFEHTPEPTDDNHEQAGEYLDVTDRLAELQAGLIDHLVDHRSTHPWEASNAFGALEYRDTKIGLDFSHVSWLDRGDILIADGTIQLLLENRSGQRYFMSLGDDHVLSGEAQMPWIVTTPVTDTFPETMTPYSIQENGLMQWSVAIELERAITLRDDADSPDLLNLSQHFRVLLPLVYTNARVLRYRP